MAERVQNERLDAADVERMRCSRAFHPDKTRRNVSNVAPRTIVDADGILLVNSNFNQIRIAMPSPFRRWLVLLLKLAKHRGQPLDIQHQIVGLDHALPS